MKIQAFFENAKLIFDKMEITPLMYGSLGLEYITGENLNADDIDVLIPAAFINEKWNEFKSVLLDAGYVLYDEHEHTFKKNDILYSYAQIEELESFAGISLSEIEIHHREDIPFRLLSLEQYLKVYLASAKDGYRVYVRQKKDRDKIAFIEKHLESKIGLRRGTVELLPHQTIWDETAARTVTLIKSLLNNVAIDVQHVGSTAIRSICAKPIIDIVVGVKNLDDIKPYIGLLEKNGIIFRKEDVKEQLLFVVGNFEKEFRTHHIHVVEWNSVAWNNYINFRDYLNSFPERAKEYDVLKKSLALEFADNRGYYTAGKKELINELLKQAYLWKNASQKSWRRSGGVKMIQAYAKEICEFLIKIPEVKSCSIYGSLSKGSFDEYSDVDIEIDVSGTDNGFFIKKLPELIAKEYDLIFYDYAPSLAPEKYILSVAMNTENPFRVVDITCTANPHCTAVSKQELAELNRRYDHTLKLFVANLKHYLRGADCHDDIEKMYRRICGQDAEICDEEQMLTVVFKWLEKNAESQHEKYIMSIAEYI